MQSKEQIIGRLLLTEEINNQEAIELLQNNLNQQKINICDCCENDLNDCDCERNKTDRYEDEKSVLVDLKEDQKFVCATCGGNHEACCATKFYKINYKSKTGISEEYLVKEDELEFIINYLELMNIKYEYNIFNSSNECPLFYEYSEKEYELDNKIEEQEEIIDELENKIKEQEGNINYYIDLSEKLEDKIKDKEAIVDKLENNLEEKEKVINYYIDLSEKLENKIEDKNKVIDELTSNLVYQQNKVIELELLKDRKDWNDFNKYFSQPLPIINNQPKTVGDICPCNPKNGGSGICNCIIANNPIDSINQKYKITTDNKTTTNITGKTYFPFNFNIT